MKLPPDIQFHEDIRLLVYRPRGSLNEASVNKIVRVIGELEARLKEPFNRFFDRRLSYQGRPPIKSAILATDSTIIHYGRLHALLTQGSPIKVRIFQDRQEAAQWLNAPIALLMPDAAETS